MTALSPPPAIPTRALSLPSDVLCLILTNVPFRATDPTFSKVSTLIVSKVDVPVVSIPAIPPPPEIPVSEEPSP